MKHTWKVAALAGGIALFGFGASVGAVSEFKSEASIKFVTEIPDIVDPEDPTKPFDPNKDPESGKTGDSGLLTLDYVSSLDFGVQTISTSEKEYKSLNLRPFIQVSDRRGTGDGWQVTAKLGEFKNGSSEGSSLVGATLTLANGEVDSPGLTTKPVANTPVTFVAGGASDTVVTAAIGEGEGTWINRWFPTIAEPITNDSVTLTVPGGVAAEGTYKADIEWTLTDAPQ